MLNWIKLHPFCWQEFSYCDTYLSLATITTSLDCSRSPKWTLQNLSAPPSQSFCPFTLNPGNCLRAFNVYASVSPGLLHPWDRSSLWPLSLAPFHSEASCFPGWHTLPHLSLVLASFQPISRYLTLTCLTFAWRFTLLEGWEGLPPRSQINRTWRPILSCECPALA